MKRTVRTSLMRSTAIIAAGALTLLSFGVSGHADVGISTEAPTATLHIVGEPQGAGRDLRVENLDPPQPEDTISIVVSDESGFIHATSIENLANSLVNFAPPAEDTTDDDWRVSRDGTDLTVDSMIYTNNNVGIGVKVPDYELDVEGDIRATGSLFASNHVITHATFATSDRRFKTDIEPYENGLDAIRRMETKTFRYTDDAPVAQTDQTYYGLIAQDAQAIDPNFVKTFSLPVKLNGTETTEYLGVDSQRLIFTLISAVQEIDTKNQEIDALERRLAVLEARMNTAEATVLLPEATTIPIKTRRGHKQRRNGTNSAVVVSNQASDLELHQNLQASSTKASRIWDAVTSVFSVSSISNSWGLF